MSAYQWTSTTEGRPEATAVCMYKINPVPNILQFFGVAVFSLFLPCDDIRQRGFFLSTGVCPSVCLSVCHVRGLYPHG